jgi:hypothetical protein
MFVAEEVTLSIGVDAAQMRLANLVAGDELVSASRATYAEHGIALLTVGPVRVVSRLVRVRLREPVVHGDTWVLALRWEAAGHGASLFPVLDADLTLRPTGERACVLRLDGSYRPPLGAVGAGLDRAVLHHVAAATVRAFTRTVAGMLTSPTRADAAAPAVWLGEPQPDAPA